VYICECDRICCVYIYKTLFVVIRNSVCLRSQDRHLLRLRYVLAFFKWYISVMNYLETYQCIWFVEKNKKFSVSIRRRMWWNFIVESARSIVFGVCCSFHFCRVVLSTHNCFYFTRKCYYLQSEHSVTLSVKNCRKVFGPSELKWTFVEIGL